MREGCGRDRSGQSGGGAMEVAVKRSMAMWGDGDLCLFLKSKRSVGLDDDDDETGEVPTYLPVTSRMQIAGVEGAVLGGAGFL